MIPSVGPGLEQIALAHGGLPTNVMGLPTPFVMIGAVGALLGLIAAFALPEIARSPMRRADRGVPDSASPVQPGKGPAAGQSFSGSVWAPGSGATFRWTGLAFVVLGFVFGLGAILAQLAWALPLAELPAHPRALPAMVLTVAGIGLLLIEHRRRPSSRHTGSLVTARSVHWPPRYIRAAASFT